MKEELYLNELKAYLHKHVGICPAYTIQKEWESRLYEVDSTNGYIELKTRPTVLSCIDWDRLDAYFLPEVNLFLRSPNFSTVAALATKALQYREGGICLGDVLTHKFINEYPEEFI